MGADDKFKDATGKAKQKAGEALGNENLEREGEVDQAQADIDRAADDLTRDPNARYE